MGSTKSEDQWETLTRNFKFSMTQNRVDFQSVFCKFTMQVNKNESDYSFYGGRFLFAIFNDDTTDLLAANRMLFFCVATSHHLQLYRNNWLC